MITIGIVIYLFSMVTMIHAMEFWRQAYSHSGILYQIVSISIMFCPVLNTSAYLAGMLDAYLTRNKRHTINSYELETFKVIYQTEIKLK
jgi:hypothetical protein